MAITSAALLLQSVTWSFSLISVSINALLIVSVRRERKTDNRFRWFNSIFLYSLYCNTLLAVLFPMIHPTYIPARNLIYIVFIGPFAAIFPKFILKLFYSFLIGIVTYQACVAPITLILRWMVIQKRISCIIFYHKTVRVLFILASIPLPIGNEIWMDFVKPSERLQSYSEESHKEAVRKLTVENFAYFVVDWNFCYLILAFLIPYLIFFLISIFFHRLYIKSIRNISNDCIDMGYHHSYTISQTFLSIALQNFLFVSLPHFILAVTVLIRWELGIRALPFSFGAVVIPLTTATTLFIHFRAYRRQVGFLFIELLRQNNVNIPIFVINQQQPSTHFQLSAAAIG